MNKTVDSEKLVERKLVELVKANHGMCIKLLSNHFIGLPDRLVLMPGGKLIFVELKTTGQKPRKIQLYVHDKLRQLGFRVDVIDTVQGVKDFVEELADKEGTPVHKEKETLSIDDIINRSISDLEE